MKIMVIDDEQDVELLFKQRFRNEIREQLIELRFAFSGQDAIEYLRTHSPPDVVYIFSDINMPGMSGLELLEVVKKEFPDIPISMITAYGDEVNYQKAMESGALNYFTKPIDFNRLKKEIVNLIE